MSATIIQLPLGRMRKPAHFRIQSLSEAATASQPGEDFQFWPGASGRRYVHTIYSLIECPALPAANYILARRGSDGARTVLRIGRVVHDAPTLNLAEIRRRGAELGANEVHVHLLPRTQCQAEHVEDDLCAGQLVAEAAGTSARGA